jgi:hemolysin activation/secretion protein
VNVGIDYKHYGQNLTTAGVVTKTPITYYPLSAIYSGSWTGKKSVTEFSIGPTFGLRQLGSDQADFTARRSGASGDFIHLRGDVSYTRDLPAGFQYFGKINGQVSSGPLVDPEQFSGGGLDTARGYLEGVAAGDNALFGTIELRSPSVASWLGEKSGEWRFYAFGDAGVLGVDHALPGQTREYDLVSVGLGSRLRLREHFTGSIDAGVPLMSVSPTRRGDVLLTFRIGADY